MRVFAIGDLHLSFSCDKPMDVFGGAWDDHVARLARAWRATVSAEDLVLIPGDISWAMHLSEAAADLAFIGGLPGKKALLRGNHDYWWNSVSQVRAALPAGVCAIQNDALLLDGVSVGGTRLWTMPNAQTSANDEKIYARELGRLELSLSRMGEGGVRIAMLHFPPFDEAHGDTAVTALLERYRVQHAVYGHLHGKAHHAAFTGEKNGVQYHFVAGDYLQFCPKQIL